MKSFVVVLLLVTIAGCMPAASTDPIIDLPTGDAAAGEVLFNTGIGSQLPCSECHSLDGARGTGPSVLGFGAIAATRQNGKDAIQYAANSIISPGSYILSGFSNLMPGTYSRDLSRQQLADLIAFLLSL
mgnify:CR=1 FL=1